MAIDYSGLRLLTARDVIAALTRDGFYFVRQVGSHQRYRHTDGRGSPSLRTAEVIRSSGRRSRA